MPLYRQWLTFRGKYDKLEQILKQAEEAALATNPHRYATPGHDDFRGKFMENFKRDHPNWYSPTVSGSRGSGALWCSPALPASQTTASASQPALPDQRERERDRQRRQRDKLQQAFAPTPDAAVPLFPSAPIQQPQFGFRFGFGAGAPASSQTQPNPTETGARRKTTRPSATYTRTNDPDRSRSSDEGTQQAGQYDPNADWRSMGGW